MDNNSQCGTSEGHLFSPGHRLGSPSRANRNFGRIPSAPSAPPPSANNDRQTAETHRKTTRPGPSAPCNLWASVCLGRPSSALSPSLRENLSSPGRARRGAQTALPPAPPVGLSPGPLMRIARAQPPPRAACSPA